MKVKNNRLSNICMFSTTKEDKVLSSNEEKVKQFVGGTG
jgi:hypothetical protein